MQANRIMKDQKVNRAGTGTAITGEVMTDEEVKAKKEQENKSGSPFAVGSYITKSNDLIQKTKYSLPRNEQKILFMLLSKIDQKNDTDASKYYTITFSDFSKLTGVNAEKPAYVAYLQHTIENLENRTFWVPIAPTKYKSMSWVRKGSIIDTEGKTISMRFNEDIWKDIAQLTSNYTSYSIEYLLMMQSTYSMRVYEIILSYDNGNRDYEYANGLVFEPMTDEVLGMFPAKRSQLRGYKYKKFGIDDFKNLLSVPTKEERGMNRKKSDVDNKYDREKPLTEKYPNFSDFERNVLKLVKNEINEMTDLWFDYEPVRTKGVRKYTHLYIFIKYKSRKEMEKVRAFLSANQRSDQEVARQQKAKKQAVLAAETGEVSPLPPAVMRMTFRKARGEIEDRAGYAGYKKELTVEERNVLANVFTYAAKILTNQNKQDQAEETLEALNGIIQNNHGLKSWALGELEKFSVMLRQDVEKKSAQYYRTVVYSDIVENSATIIEGGKRRMGHDGKEPMFRLDETTFEE